MATSRRTKAADENKGLTMQPIDGHRAAIRLSHLIDRVPAKNADFARSLLSQWNARGYLSDKQAYWANRIADEAIAPKVIPTTNAADELTYAKIQAIFTAASQYLQRPRIRLPVDGRTIDLKRASDTSRNPGSVYVTQGTDYIGAITPAGDWKPGRGHITPAIRAAIEALASDPKSALAAAGKATGACCLCARTLSDPASIAAGIGPICSKRWSL